MADEGPKDYSRLYTEERPPPIPSGRGGQSNRLHQKLALLQMDGASQALKHRELDLKEVVSKLQNHITSCNSHAKEALSEHYTSFVGAKHAKYRVLIKYPNSISSSNKGDEVYAVRVHSNTLRAVREKLPRRGNFRYFFRTHNCLEEIESDDTPVPIYTEKEGYKQIHVHLFDRTV